MPMDHWENIRIGDREFDRLKRYATFMDLDIEVSLVQVFGFEFGRQ